MNETIKKYQFKDGLHLEFEILDLKELLKRKGHMMTVPHRAQFYHIIWIEKGYGTHLVDFKPITIEDNTILFIPQDSVNLYDIEGEYQGKTMIFTDKFFFKNHQDAQFLHSTPLYSNLYDTAKIRFNPSLSDLKVFFNAMETEFVRAPDNAQFSILHNMLHIFLLKAERELQSQGFVKLEPSANLDYLVLFKDLLEKNFRTDKSVNKYASSLSISEKQLHKATTTLMDKTPKQIIDERVLLEAKRLLAHSNQSIKEIAYELGYDEPTNFIKYFRKRVSTTPSEFRDQF